MYNGDLSMNTWTVPQFALFNLEKDIEEATDVSDQNQKVFDQLKNQLQSIIKQGRTRHWTTSPNTTMITYLGFSYSQRLDGDWNVITINNKNR